MKIQILFEVWLGVVCNNACTETMVPYCVELVILLIVRFVMDWLNYCESGLWYNSTLIFAVKQVRHNLFKKKATTYTGLKNMIA